MSFFVSCVWLDLNHSLLRLPKATEGVGEQVKTIEYRFHEAINENKEHDEPSVSEASRRSQATIFSEGQQIPPPQPTLRTDLDIGAEKSETIRFFAQRDKN